MLLEKRERNKKKRNIGQENSFAVLFIRCIRWLLLGKFLVSKNVIHVIILQKRKVVSKLNIYNFWNILFSLSLHTHYNIIPPNLMNIFYITHSTVCNELLQILNMLKSEIQIFQGARIWIIKGRYDTRIYGRILAF